MKALGIYTSEISVSVLSMAGLSEVLVRVLDIQNDYVFSYVMFLYFFPPWKLEEMIAK